MSKINNQSNRLDNINFVQDITPETAANYSGGISYVFGNDIGDRADVVLYKDPGQQGQQIGINAAPGESTNIGLANGRDTTFNDEVSSIRVNRGSWQFFADTNLGGNTTGVLAPGRYSLGINDDEITDALRVT